MALKKLLQDLVRIRQLIENTPEAPCHDDPNLHVWVETADRTLDTVLAIVEDILEDTK